MKKSYSDSYFIYDHSNLVKKSFLTELNQFILIYHSVTYFEEKQKNLIELISAHKSLKFKIEKDCFK